MTSRERQPNDALKLGVSPRGTSRHPLPRARRGTVYLFADVDIVPDPPQKQRSTAQHDDRKRGNMPRRKFLAERQPLRHHAGLQLQPSHVTGALSFLNPTHARFRPTANLAAQGLEQRGAVDEVYSQESAEPERKLNSLYPENVEFLWRSRDNRKGRHAIKVQYKDHVSFRYVMPQKTATMRAVLKGIWRMATFFPYWDISYLVAMAFTIGSSFWVINSFFVWFPLERPEMEFPHEILVGGGVTALLGTTTFEIGSILMMLEAMNENATGCFGWALEQAFEEIEKEAGGVIMELKPRKDRCLHHHLKKSFFRKARRCPTDAPMKAPPDTDCRSFKWLPTLTELRMQYLREIGFIASVAQLIGATVFYTSGYTGLPGIYDHMSKGLIDGIYWTPQIVGGSLFITSGYVVRPFARQQR